MRDPRLWRSTAAEQLVPAHRQAPAPAPAPQPAADALALGDSSDSDAPSADDADGADSWEQAKAAHHAAMARPRTSAHLATLSPFESLRHCTRRPARPGTERNAHGKLQLRECQHTLTHVLCYARRRRSTRPRRRRTRPPRACSPRRTSASRPRARRRPARARSRTGWPARRWRPRPRRARLRRARAARRPRARRPRRPPPPLPARSPRVAVRARPA